MDTLPELTARLCRISEEHFIDPFSRLQWPDALAHDQWFMTPKLISLHGTEYYDTLDEKQQKILSFFELINFFSINIHGERMLIEGLAKRLYRKHTETVSPYLHHFLDEENKHMIYFGRFCNRYAGKVYAEKKFTVARDYADGEEDFLFFARAMLFEEMVDIYNRRMAKDQTLVALSREINWLHHFEEARHLVFGRRLVEELFESHCGSWQSEDRQRIADELVQFFDATWKEFFNPEAYKDAGLEDVYALRREALANSAVMKKYETHRARCARTLYKIGLLTQETMQ